MNNRKGITLIELIIAMAIGSIIIVTAYNILFVGIKSHSNALKTFEKQSDIRYAIEITNNAIKFASVGFAVTEDDFNPIIEGNNVKGLVKPWDYIGLSPDRKSIVHYKYEGIDDKSGSYKINVLAEELKDLTYNLVFNKPEASQKDKLVKYILKINSDGKEEVIITEVEAINAIHIVDWGDANKPAVAFAFRTEKTPEINKKPIAAISMVLDTSGSMNWDMDGNEIKGSNKNPSRISLLKNTLTDPTEGLFSILKESDVYVSLVPFSYNANIPHTNYKNKDVKNIDLSKFYNVKNEKLKLDTMVNALSADGATNTGDGIRRAYYQLKTFEDERNSKYGLNSNQNVKNYMIILVDGVTTAASANIDVSTYPHNFYYRGKNPRLIIDNKENIGDNFYTSNSNLSGYNRLDNSNYTIDSNPIPRAIGDGVKLDEEYGERYIRELGQMIKRSKSLGQVFVIGYSNKIVDGKYAELESLTNIATSLGIEVNSKEASEKFENNDFIFVATDKDSLKEAFKNIGGYISEDLWQIEGPRIKP